MAPKDGCKKVPFVSLSKVIKYLNAFIQWFSNEIWSKKYYYTFQYIQRFDNKCEVPKCFPDEIFLFYRKFWEHLLRKENRVLLTQYETIQNHFSEWLFEIHFKVVMMIMIITLVEPDQEGYRTVSSPAVFFVFVFLFCFCFCFLFCFVLFCFVLLCFALFCFVLFCFVLFCFVLFCFVLFFLRVKYTISGNISHNVIENNQNWPIIAKLYCKYVCTLRRNHYAAFYHRN